MRKTIFAILLAALLIVIPAFFVIVAVRSPSGDRKAGSEREEKKPDTVFTSCSIDDPAALSGGISRADTPNEMHYTFFSSVNFTSIAGRGDSLWAMGEKIIMEMLPSTGDMRIRDSGDGVSEGISGMRSNGHLVYYRGEESFFRYDIGMNTFERAALSDDMEMIGVLDYNPLVWEDDEGALIEGLVLVRDDDIILLEHAGPGGFSQSYRRSLPSGIGEYRWMNGVLDRVFIGFTGGILIATPEDVTEIEGDIGSDAGIIHGHSYRNDSIALEFAIAREGVIRGYSYVSGPEEVSAELVENETMWDTGLDGTITSLCVMSDIIAAASGDDIMVRRTSGENSISVPGLDGLTLVGDEVYLLVNGTLCTVSGKEVRDINININAPAPDLVHMNTGDKLLLAGSNTTVSVLPGATAPARWINTEAILGIHLKRPVQCLDEDGNIWLAQTGELFGGELSGNEIDWNLYLVNSIRSPLSVSALKGHLMIVNETALVLFNKTMRTDEIILVSDNSTGEFVKGIGDTYGDCFWVLCENGVMKLVREDNGSMNTTFFGKWLLPGHKVIDIGTSQNVLWVLMDEGLGRYYKPLDEWWNHSHSEDMMEAELDTLYSIGHEIYVGGNGLFYMDEWSGVGGFMPLSFGEGELTSIASVDGRAFQEDDTGEIYILDSGGIRIYDTSRSNWQSLTTSNGLASNDIRQVIKDETTGDIWVAAYGGVTKYEPGNSTFRVITADDGLANNFVYTGHADAEGIWFGTDGGGVNIIRRDGEIEILTMKDGLVADDVLKIKSFEDGKYWFCTDAGLTYYDRETGDTTNYESPKHLAGEWVWDIDYLDGKIFVATDRGISVLTESTGKWQRFYHPLDMPDNNVFAVDVFKHNHQRYVWAGTASAAVCYNVDKDLWINLDEGSGMDNARVRDVFYDGEKVWVASGAGAYLFTPGGELLGSYSREDGLVHNMVESFSKYEDVMYIATSGGFSTFREGTITNSLLPRFIETPGTLPDISIEDYVLNVSYDPGRMKTRVVINVTLRTDVDGNLILYAGTVRPSDLPDVQRTLFWGAPQGSGSWALAEISGSQCDIDGFVSVEVEIEVDGIPDFSAPGDTPNELRLFKIPLYFLIDPDGRWIEESENNNLVITSVDLEGSTEDRDEIKDEESSWKFLLMYNIFLLLIVALMLGLSLRERNKHRKLANGKKTEFVVEPDEGSACRAPGGIIK